jgi:hypothetical protein
MASDLVRARRRVAAAVTAFVLVAGAFAYAFYYFDGMDVIEDIRSGEWLASREETPTVAPTGEPDPEAVLEDVPDSVVLRLWQEQSAGQDSIARLLSGDIVALVPATATVDAALAELPVTLELKDGSTTSGALVFERVDGDWLLLSANTAAAEGTSGGSSGAKAGPVDRRIVSAIVACQRERQDTVEDLLEGSVTRLDVVGVIEGLGTRTVDLRVHRGRDVTAASLVFITPADDGVEWFIAGFVENAARL